MFSFLKSKKWLVLLMVTLLQAGITQAQTAPDFPVSYRIFSPSVFNPAIAGSKDFSSVGLIVSNYGNINAQLATTSMRLSKSRSEYFTSQPVPEFTNIGIGGYIFNEINDPTQNIGVGATGSYHLQLDREALSFLSAGITAKAILNRYAGDTDLGDPAQDTFFPDLDAGIYYYGPSFYAGISATNIIGPPDSQDSLAVYSIPVSRSYFLYTGYKIILSRSENIVLEPSLIVTTGDSIPGDITDIFKPGLKLYAGDFCIGTFFNDFSKISFFGQYKYSRTYLGAYFELPWKAAYYKQPVIVEFAIGINISAVKSGMPRTYHW